MAKTEHVDQVRLVMHLRTFYPEILVAAIPNGAAVSPAQRMRLVAEGLLAGFPDVFVAEARNKYHGLFVEMKVLTLTGRSKAVVSEDQKRVHEQLRARGYKVVICMGYIHARDEVLKYLDPKNSQ